jgi:hypothetical protein
MMKYPLQPAHLTEALERLREAESILGSPTTEMPPFTDEGRQRWLEQTRVLLAECGIEAENLSGRWHTRAAKKRGSLTMDIRDKRTVDVTAPEIVQIVIRDDAKVVWVNVDGVCLFRACRVGRLEVEDQRKGLPVSGDRIFALTAVELGFRYAEKGMSLGEALARAMEVYNGKEVVKDGSIDGSGEAAAPSKRDVGKGEV